MTKIPTGNSGSLLWVGGGLSPVAATTGSVINIILEHIRPRVLRGIMGGLDINWDYYIPHLREGWKE